jgi:hypothetical protein
MLRAGKNVIQVELRIQRVRRIALHGIRAQNRVAEDQKGAEMSLC